MSVRMLCLGPSLERADLYLSGSSARTSTVGLRRRCPRARRHRRPGRPRRRVRLLPDLCIVNWYSHVEPDGAAPGQGRESRVDRSGAPVVSFSIGDSARFLFGGLKRKDPVEKFLLESGDVFVFGGSRGCAITE